MTMRIESTIHYAELVVIDDKGAACGALAETSAGVRVTIYRRGGRIDGRQSRANAWKLLHRDVLPVRDVLRAADAVRGMLSALDKTG